MALSIYLNFHKEIMAWGIPHFFTDPHCPKQNGRVERLHQNSGVMNTSITNTIYLMI